MEPDYIGWEAATKALFDGGNTYDSIKAAVVGYVVGESTTGRAALYQLCLWASRSRTCGAHLARLEVWSADALVFGAVAAEYFRKYGGGVEHLAKRVAKNDKHSVNNPYSQFQAGRSCARYTRNEAFVHDNKLKNQAIELVATGIATDYLDAFAGRSAIEAVARNLLGTWTVRLDDARRFVERGENTSGGKYVVNPSGGPEAKCHPLGATGNALLDHKYAPSPNSPDRLLTSHFVSATTKLTAGPGPMQAPGLLDIPDARGKYGLVHNIGLGGAVVINLLRLPEFYHDDGLDG
ncbi:hypothetical protein EI94DRAFT_1709229, partial [Lactarius quietus]